ncbi:MAG: transposase [Lewinellaceae bacterium]|nr:transposase [Lewinellaceae bacterium]
MTRIHLQVQEWAVVYNTMRPHCFIGYMTPDEIEIGNQSLYFRAVAA